jgi:hypothetical protein
VTFAPAAGRSTTPLIKLAHATLTVNGSLTARQSRKTKAQLVPGSQCGLRRSGRSLASVGIFFDLLFWPPQFRTYRAGSSWLFFGVVPFLATTVLYLLYWKLLVFFGSYLPTSYYLEILHLFLLGDPSSLLVPTWRSFISSLVFCTYSEILRLFVYLLGDPSSLNTWRSFISFVATGRSFISFLVLVLTGRSFISSVPTERSSISIWC